jgi:hypothetical protein
MTGAAGLLTTGGASTHPVKNKPSMTMLNHKKLVAFMLLVFVLPGCTSLAIVDFINIFKTVWFLRPVKTAMRATQQANLARLVVV